MKNSTLTHVQAVKRMVRYLKGTMKLGKRFGRYSERGSSDRWPRLRLEHDSRRDGKPLKRSPQRPCSL